MPPYPHMPASGTVSPPAFLTNAGAGAAVFGQPIYAVGAGTFDLAVGSALAKAIVVGLVPVASVAPGGGTIPLSIGVLVGLTSLWDAIAGTSGGLAFGVTYYLDPSAPGHITATAPTTPGQFVVQIGIGLSPTQLALAIQPPVGL